MKVAIVHDFFCNLGGADAIVGIFHELFPEAPVFSLVVYDRNRDAELLRTMDLRTSFIQHLPFAGRSHQAYLPLFPTAIEQFDLSDYDLILSQSTSVAKGVLTKPETLHICYCNTPMRYAWDMYHEYMKREVRNPLARLIIPLLMNYLRTWDAVSASRVDHFIANSRNVARRIRKHYGRDSVVINPPVDTNYFLPSDTDDEFFLIVSRLVPYKRVDLAIEAFNTLGLPLRIIGGGTELKKLRKMAGPNVTLLGEQPRAVVREHMAKCRAFVFPGEEDFGIAPLEAQSAGRPVIAFAAGGAMETVIEGRTGTFFHEQSVPDLIDAVQRFEKMRFDKGVVRQNALDYDTQLFRQKILEFVNQKYSEHLESLYPSRKLALV